MNYVRILCIVTLLFFAACAKQPRIFNPLPIATSAPINDQTHIRFISMKHSHERLADNEAIMTLNMVKEMQAKGLSIEIIGNHNIDRDGLKVITFDFSNIDGFRRYVSEQMKVNARPDDTFMIFTIGHGFRSGGLDNMGQRAGVMKAIAAAAEENRQRTFWWELSCYATASLPSIDTLPAEQRKWLTIVASSPSNQPSPAGIEYRAMKQMFTGIVERSETIDPNQDGMITGKELKDFLNTTNPRRGHLCFMDDYSKIVFGFYNIANEIPIRNWTGAPREFPDDYVPYPGR